MISLPDLLTASGIAVAISVVMELIKKVVTIPPEILDKWGWAMAIGLGVVIGGGAALIQHAEIGIALYNGVIAGLMSIGVYKSVTGATSTAAG